MSLALTEDHRVLAEVARSMLTERDASGAARAALEGNPEPAAALWKEMVALGWPGLHVPESYGGQGYGLARNWPSSPKNSADMPPLVRS